MSRTKRAKTKASADTTPLRVSASTGISHFVRQPREGLLQLLPAMFSLWAGAATGPIFIVIGTVILLSGQWAGALFAAVGALGLLIFVLMMVFTKRVEFDRDSGTWSLRRGGTTRYRPLDSIVAVQVIDGGWHGGVDHGKYFTYQLNLVIADPDEPRLNLTNVSNWEATWTIGSQLSEFLGVELLDQVSRSE
jgi:hypothetical protein